MFLREKFDGYLRGVYHGLRLAGGGEYRIRRGAMILDFLLRRGESLPHLCKLGDCARCKAVLLEGRVKSATFEPHALKASEIERGVFLACRATPLEDVHIVVLKDADAKARRSARGRIET